jgi:hypothetical protein
VDYFWGALILGETQRYGEGEEQRRVKDEGRTPLLLLLLVGELAVCPLFLFLYKILE